MRIENYYTYRYKRGGVGDWLGRLDSVKYGTEVVNNYPVSKHNNMKAQG
jgi:hypothetical protein